MQPGNGDKKEVDVMIIGDFTGVLYVVIATLGVLLASYGAALVVSFKVRHPKTAPKDTQPAIGMAP
jgi:hypothetical protein